MRKKGKKTKADEKEDAFERLYAILAASTPGLPSLAPLPKEERPIIIPTQVDKEKEKAEFDKLFAQLSSLSQRKKESLPIVRETPNIDCIQEQDCTKDRTKDRTQDQDHDLNGFKIDHDLNGFKIDHDLNGSKDQDASKDRTKDQDHDLNGFKIDHDLDDSKDQDQSDENQFEEIYAQIVHIIAMKSQMQSIKPNKRTTRNKTRNKQNDTHDNPKEEILQCAACCKIFSTKGCYNRHQHTSSICQSLLSLPADQQHPVVEIPIHVKVNEYLEQAITGEPLQCRFCLARFFNRGNHHKHYQTALPCNRMAYAEFKRLVAL